MADLEKDKQLDDLLESLLSTYSVAEPRPGLETRILAQVRDAASRRRPGLWMLGWLGAAAAGIAVIVLLLYFSRPALQPYRAPLKAIKPLVQPLVKPHSRQEAGSVRAIKASDRIPKAPQEAQEKEDTVAIQDRPSIFPTPVPLSDQEKLFFRYLANTPRDEVIAQSHSEEVVDGFPEDQSAIPAVRQLTTNGTR